MSERNKKMTEPWQKKRVALEYKSSPLIYS